MVVAAFFGMATKYSEGLLAIKYRTIDKDGHVLGGPFYYIENGMGKQWRWLAKIFAFFGAGVGLFGIGTFTQVNGIASAVKNFFDPDTVYTVSILGRDYSWATVIACLILTVCVGLVVLGGIKRIANVSQVIVPFMAVLYVALALIIVITNITAVPAAIVQIVKTAFSGSALAGGAMGTMVVAMQKGIARGIILRMNPLAIPFCIATTIVPIAPPARALPEKAVFTIWTMAAGTAVIFVITMINASATYRTCHKWYNNLRNIWKFAGYHR